MKDIQLKELARCIKFIEATDCKYKIITPDGQEFGQLEVMVKMTRRPLKYPFGSVAKHYKQQLNLNLPVGDVQEIACGEYPPEMIRGGLASMLSVKWGKDTYATATKGNVVEILRTA